MRLRLQCFKIDQIYKAMSSPEFVICITGERKNTIYRSSIHRMLVKHHPTKCIFGECSGVDQTAREICDELKIPYQIYYADWERYGRAAGPIRNRQMIDTKPDLVLAFHDNLAMSKGTKNTVDQARKAKIPVQVVLSEK